MTDDDDGSDPFACFGDDDDDGIVGDNDDDDDGCNDGETKYNNIVTNSALDSTSDNDLTTTTTQKRDPNCGSLAFHAGTEQALLMHVEREILSKATTITTTTISKIENDNNNNLAPQTESSAAKVVLNAIDDFCITRHWMMHVGSEKGKIIESFVEEFCAFITTTKKKNITLLELGTYCGYSSILIMSKLLCDDEMKSLLLGGGDDDDEKPSLSFYTVEVVESNAQIAKQLIKLAGLEDYIHVLRFDPFKESLTTYLKREMSSGNTTNNIDTNAEEVDFLFIDHDKDLYLPDLQELENSGFIKEGCHVAGDNVVFAKIDNYRDYVAQLQKEGIVQTRLEESRLEYCDPDLYENDDAKNDEVFRDGIELTVYLKDPPSIV